MVRGLHHAAYRCRDAEQTREFYEDFLGLPLVDAFEIQATITNKDTPVCCAVHLLAASILCAASFALVG
jgi:catechol 2,3-dioxygenase-like lactoylglutathione lyase family enzyme